jgi:hypothetical protein
MADHIDHSENERHGGELTSSHIDDPAKEAHECESTPSPTDQPKRRDLGGLHAPRNSVLSHGLLEFLRTDGQNIRALRAREAALRKMLRPEGPLGEMFFDQFSASSLRLIVAARLEKKILTQEKPADQTKSLPPELYRQLAPMLITHQGEDNSAERKGQDGCDAELLHQLLLIARYQRAAAREQYRSLNILLLLRDQGEDLGLRNWLSAQVGVKPKH